MITTHLHLLQALDTPLPPHWYMFTGPDQRPWCGSYKNGTRTSSRVASQLPLNFSPLLAVSGTNGTKQLPASTRTTLSSSAWCARAAQPPTHATAYHGHRACMHPIQIAKERQRTSASRADMNKSLMSLPLDKDSMCVLLTFIGKIVEEQIELSKQISAPIST